MVTPASKGKGLKQGQSVRLKLTDEQRAQFKKETGSDVEYVVVTTMSKPVEVVYVQGHLADDALID